MTRIVRTEIQGKTYATVHPVDITHQRIVLVEIAGVRYPAIYSEDQFTQEIIVKPEYKPLPSDAALLQRMKEYIEETEVSLDNELGTGSTLQRLIADGDMPDLYHELEDIINGRIPNL